MRDIANEIVGREGDDELRKDEFWALKDVSFELKRGECLGLIGHNGAGKSTLLKMLNGLIKPDKGQITMRGRVCALIELGAGFNPILTGRENIYINAAVLGISKKEIDAKFDAIVDFAEIGEFIDSPVQNYSSGMKVRLGFAVAAQMEPDVLLIDEVLAVGDAGFRAKCYNTIYKICENASVIFVSHAMPQISRLCSSAIMLTHGREISKTRETELVIDEYNRSFHSDQFAVNQHPDVSINNLAVNGKQGDNWNVEHGQAFEVSFEMKIPAKYKELEIVLCFSQPSMDLLGYCSSRLQNETIPNSGAVQQCSIVIDKLLLGSGKKILSLTIRDAETNEILCWLYAFGSIFISHAIFIPAPVYFTANFSVHCDKPKLTDA
jgi:lipopolysaccharide transport system ATP-binding protein